jgi:HAD superfamily hydrolase (TIGR01549 family)
MEMGRTDQRSDRANTIDQLIMKIKTIILDFDGTIVESVGIKDWAFETLFKEYPEHLDEIMKYHLSHNATVRFKKFRYIVEKILGQEYGGEIERKLSDEFSKLVFEHIVQCPYVPGAEEFLDCFWSKIPLYLISVSPAEELERILKARDLNKYFRKIYAIPWVKTEAIKDILKSENISAEEAVFIGDAFEDYEAARSTNLFFIGRDSHKSFRGAKIPIYENMFDIKKSLVKNTQ